MNIRFMAAAALLVPMATHAQQSPQTAASIPDKEYRNWVRPVSDGESGRADITASNAEAHTLLNRVPVALPSAAGPSAIPGSDADTHSLLAQILATLQDMQVTPEACEPAVGQ